MNYSKRYFLIVFVLLLAALACSFGDNGREISHELPISGFVWIDTNQNGVYDNGELPANGITVTAFGEESKVLGTAVTGADGMYDFSATAETAEQVTLSFTIPADWEFSPKGAGEGISSDVFPEGDQRGETETFEFGVNAVKNAGIYEQTPVVVEENEYQATPTSPATPTPQTTEIKFFFLPYSIYWVQHGDGISWIYVETWVQDQDNSAVEDGICTATLGYPDGSEETQQVEIGPSSSCEFEYEIYQYGDYLFRMDQVDVPEMYYQAALNFATEIPITVTASEEPQAPIGRVAEFYDQFNQNFQNQNVDGLLNTLHPIVLEQYPGGACRTYLEGTIDKTIQVSVLGVTDFGRWDWPVGDQTVQIWNTYTVDVEIVLPDNSRVQQETHLALNPETQELNWLTYCEND